MDAQVVWMLQNADRIGSYVLLLLTVVGFMRGWLVPGPTHNRVIIERDRYLEMATRGMELAKRAADVAVKVP